MRNLVNRLTKRTKLLLGALIVVIFSIPCYNYMFPLGKYVYLEDINMEMQAYNVCHTKNNCDKIKGTIKRFESEQLKSINTSGWKFCPKCVSDRAFEAITE